MTDFLDVLGLAALVFLESLGELIELLRSTEVPSAFGCLELIVSDTFSLPVEESLTSGLTRFAGLDVSVPCRLLDVEPWPSSPELSRLALCRLLTLFEFLRRDLVMSVTASVLPLLELLRHDFKGTTRFFPSTFTPTSPVFGVDTSSVWRSKTWLFFVTGGFTKSHSE